MSIKDLSPAAWRWRPEGQERWRYCATIRPASDRYGAFTPIEQEPLYALSDMRDCGLLDGLAIAMAPDRAACGDMPVPKDWQARAESIALNTTASSNKEK